MTQQASLGTVMLMIMPMMIMHMIMMGGWLAGGRSCPALSLVVWGVFITTGAGVLLVRMVCVAAQQMIKIK
jgi:hypothetical protein